MEPYEDLLSELDMLLVMTVEPGIYLPDDDSVPARFRGMGIRIEDDVLVTRDGNEVLTAAAPKRIKDIEAVMTKSQILRYWVSRYGELSPASRDRFLKRKEVARLTRYPDAIVKRAIGFSSLLSDALSFAHAAYEGEARPLPAEPARSDSVALPAPRPLPRDVNADFRRRLGRTQHYGDEY